MAPSKLPKEILALGAYLVRELGLQESTDTLSRWLAHHLAEVMARAKAEKSPAARREASVLATDVILKIWERRTVLPGNAYPLAPYKDILKVLSLMGPDANPWRRVHGTHYQVLASTIYDRLSRIVIGLLLIDAAPQLSTVSSKKNKSQEFLSNQERAILEELERWQEAVGSGKPSATNKSKPEDSDVRKSLQQLADETIKQLQELQERLKKDLATTCGTDKAARKRTRKSGDAQGTTRHVRARKRPK